MSSSWLAARVLALLLAQFDGASEPAAARYGLRGGPGPMDEVRLGEYAPISTLSTPVTPIARARFPVIDVHAHASMAGVETPADVDEWVRVMDEVGVETTVILTGASGERFERLAALFLSRHPRRFQLWCSLDFTEVDAPDYPARAAASVARCRQQGGRGLGELSDKGWGLQGGGERPRNERLHVDDPRLAPAWEKAAELGMPVSVHVADHPAAWQPLGPHQERTGAFQQFNLHGKDVPSHAEMIARSDRMLARHPRTKFIACHLRNQGHDLAALGRALDRFPNLYLDLSARDYELGRQPRGAARFLARYRDRVLFGSDMGRQKEMYRAWWRLLESTDEFMPGRLWWRQYGLALPPPVLDAIYRRNARRILDWRPPLARGAAR